MSLRNSIALLAFAAVLAGSPALAQSDSAAAARLEKDVRILADDSMEGRETGEPGYDLAAGYVAGQFAAIGLQPSANGTYFQSVPLLSYRSDQEQPGTLSIDGVEGFSELVAGKDYFASGSPLAAEHSLTAPLVYVGYGFRADGNPWDDFAGVDLKGKIAVGVFGAPATLSSEERAHYTATARERVSQAGAIGMMGLWTPTTEALFPWEQFLIHSANSPTMTWVDDAGSPFIRSPNVQAYAVLSGPAAKLLFEGQPVGWDAIVAADKDGKAPIKSFALGRSATINFAVTSEKVNSRNVVAVLPGSDPQLADEIIVVTAHLDHMGIFPTSEQGDDEVMNGAMDNASGIASMLEVARQLVANPPRRTIMFAAVTAEEVGLVGSEYLARHPLVKPGQRFVANVNLDMPIMTWEFSDVVAFGSERSTLFPVVEQATKRAGLTLAPDPMPEQGLFTRSDQYSFVEQGIPSIYLTPGFGNGGGEAQGAFLSQHYHHPSDEAGLLRYDQLARFSTVNAEIVRGIGDMGKAPVWNKGDFFGTIFKGPMAD